MNESVGCKTCTILTIGGIMDKGEIKFTNNKELIEASNNDNIKVLSKENIECLHTIALEDFGGSDGIRDEGLLDSVCVAPYQSVFEQDLYPTIYDKAAKLLFDFANYQIFVDGNKRTAVYTCITFLNINNYDLLLDNNELYNLTMNVANNHIDLPEVSKIIENNVIHIDYKPSKNYKDISINEDKEQNYEERE